MLVGGTTAIERDLREASTRDNRLIIPLVLLVVFLVLIVLLRALAAPLLLMATVVLSFAAALGVSYVVFDVLFGFPGSDPSLPLFAFVFLVALGIDYNIFLMARVREETQRYGTEHGHAPRARRDRRRHHLRRHRAGRHVRGAGGAAARAR